MTKGLAWCGNIVYLSPIENAEFIEAATVICDKGGRWIGVVKKGDFSTGQPVEVYVQDALLSRDNPRFAFMEKRDWRIRMMRLRGVPSECLIMPWEQDFYPVIGDDITERVGVQKFERQIPLNLAGDIAGSFPSFVSKTDEPNFQSVTHLIEGLWGLPWYATVKYDGSSGTAYWEDDRLRVCSRNWELKDTPGTAAWELARKYHLEDVLRGSRLVIQFEMLGGKIKGNPLGLKEPEIRVFNIWSRDRNEYYSVGDLIRFCNATNLPVAEVVANGNSFNLTDEQLRSLAEQQKYPNGKPAEGIVVRPQKEMRVQGDRLSFKVINLRYKESN